PDLVYRGRPRIGSGRDVATFFLVAHAPRQHSKQRHPPDEKVDGDDRAGAHLPDRGLPISSGLFEFNERAAKVLRVKKQNGFAVRADFRLAVAKNARALRFERVTGGTDVRNFVADVMDAAVGILLEELRDGRFGAEWLQQFNLGVGKRNEHGRYAMFGLGHL